MIAIATIKHFSAAILFYIRSRVDVFDEAAEALKLLVTTVLQRGEKFGELEKAEILPSSQSGHIARETSNGNDDGDGHKIDDANFITDIVHTIVNTAVSRVELTNTTQSVMAAISRHGGSGGGGSFWKEMIFGCAVPVFGTLKNSNRANELKAESFAVLAQIIKIGSGDVRKMSSDGKPVLRDFYNKLLR